MTTQIWRKSSRSNDQSACIELASTLAAVRDSKNPTGPTLHGDIRQLLRAIKAGAV